MKSNKMDSQAQLFNSLSPGPAANTLHIGLFQGEQPALSRLTQGWGNLAAIPWASACTSLGLLSDNFLGSRTFPAMTLAVSNTSRLCTLPFASQAGGLVPVKAGIPTFFVMRVSVATTATTWAGFSHSASPSNMLTGPVIIGSVGLEGSNAELQINNLNLLTGQSYALLDLTFQL